MALLLLLSGAVALVYEVTWQRKFSLLFGSSASATAAVLAGYFAGLTLGSFVFGKFSNQRKSPLRTYGWLEIGVGASALAVDPVLNLYSGLYPKIIAHLGTHPAGLIAVKAALAFLAIVLPTVAMGATLPVLANFFSADRQRIGARLALLYAANTLGAALGTVAVPLILLPQFGMNTLTWICAGTNVTIGLVALHLARRSPVSPLEHARATSAPIPPLFLQLSFFSGAGAFILQVMWNRAFAQVHDNSLHAFAGITATFILALAAGGHLARFLLRSTHPARCFGLGWLIGGILATAAPAVYLWLTHNLSFHRPAGNVLGLDSALLLAAGLLVFVPIALLSSGLPIFIQAVCSGTNTSAAAATGTVLAANTMGCFVGALLGGFVLPQFVGLWKSIAGTGVLFVALGTSFVFNRGSALALNWPTPWRSIPAAVATLAGLVLVFSTNLSRTSLARSESLLSLKEGPHGITAAVQRSDGSRRLKLNNHYVLGGTLSTGDQRMQAHIPLLSAGRGGPALFLGYGTGITAGAASFHPQFQTRAVELVPEVAELAGHYFADENGNFNSSPRLILDDARNFLRGTTERFAVIIGDLVVPWRPGESALYTTEHFHAARAALAENGVFCAWIPMFQIREPEFQIILATFLDVFGHVFVWRGDFSPLQPAYALVAYKKGVPALDPEAINAALSRMLPDPQNLQLQTVAALWIHFVGLVTPSGIGESRVPRNSENTPVLEVNHRARSHLAEQGYFVGRALQAWENSVRESSLHLASRLEGEARLGWKAGRTIVEFTQLLAEGRKEEAAQLQQELRRILGDRVAKLIL